VCTSFNFSTLLVSIGAAICNLLVAQATADEPRRPNILVIVADDLGYSDLSCFGGDIPAPALSHLADQGVRFTNYLVNPMCVVTRTSLLTGQNHTQSNGHRNSVPIAGVLRDHGYRTSISGKWHQPGNPLDAGFDHFYGFLGGEINSWTGVNRNVPVIQTDRQPPEPVSPGWYASDAFTNDCLNQIDAAVEADQPFFCYLAFNAPHGPHHAPRKNVEKYAGAFDAGWTEMRENRYQRMLAMGIIDDRHRLTDPEAEVRRWDELPEATQKLESRRFQAYAGMVDRMDENIGRVLDHLETLSLTDDTLVIFFSDNGGDYGHGDSKTAEIETPWAAQGPRPAHANGWALLKSTPFRWYKSSAFQGGVASPLIVSWPNGLNAAAGSIQRQRLHVTDWYPTFLDLAGAAVPDLVAHDDTNRLMGSSILPLWRDSGLPELAIHNRVIWEYEDVSKGLLKDHWKIVSINDGPWLLFDVANDPAESVDVSADHPDIRTRLAAEWFAFEEHFPWLHDDWHQAVKTDQQGWGFHRLKLALPITSLAPRMSATDTPLQTDIRLTFASKPTLKPRNNASFRLYSCRNPTTPVYEFGRSGSGTASIENNTLVLRGIPLLQPDTTYFVVADPGWINVGGRPAGPINDGSIWYRFRTR